MMAPSVSLAAGMNEDDAIAHEGQRHWHVEHRRLPRQHLVHCVEGQRVRALQANLAALGAVTVWCPPLRRRPRQSPENAATARRPSTPRRGPSVIDDSGRASLSQVVLWNTREDRPKMPTPRRGDNVGARRTVHDNRCRTAPWQQSTAVCRPAGTYTFPLTRDARFAGRIPATQAAVLHYGRAHPGRAAATHPHSSYAAAGWHRVPGEHERAKKNVAGEQDKKCAGGRRQHAPTRGRTGVSDCSAPRWPSDNSATTSTQ